MKRGTPEHPKTLALMEELGVSKPTAVGLLELLWHFTARFAPRGDIGRFGNRAISSAVGWDGDPDALIAALVKCRWLDEDKEHRLIVHDWSEHADSAVRMWLARRGLEFVDGSPACRKAVKAQTTAAGEQGKSLAAHRVATECNLKSQQSDITDAANLNLKPQQSAITSATLDCTKSHHKCSPPEAGSQNPEPEARAGSQKPEPVPEPAARASPRGTNGSAGSPEWICAIETALQAAVGRPPRPGTAMRLASAAAAIGVHPRYVARWITERNGSPPKSDGLYLSIVESDLAEWLRRQQCDSAYLPVEQVMCPKCGGKITAFRDVIVPCGCDTDRSRAPTLRRAAEPVSSEAEALCSECT